MCIQGADGESRIIHMVMREEERRYNQGLVHRKCQTLNKNKVAGRAPITNTLNSCQTNTPQESRVERGKRREGLEGTEGDKSISCQTILHLKVSTTAGNLSPCSCPHLSAPLCPHTVHPRLNLNLPGGPLTFTNNYLIHPHDAGEHKSKLSQIVTSQK